MKHGNSVLVHYLQGVNKNAQEALILNTVEYLVSKGADVNAKAENGVSLDAHLGGDLMFARCFSQRTRL